LAAFTPLTADDLAVFLGDFDLEAPSRAASYAPVAGGSVNSNFVVDIGRQRVFLRIYEEQDREGATAEAAMLERLATRGVPTPAPLLRRDGAAIGTLCGKPAALFPWREGAMRCQASVGTHEARWIGEALAKVHVAGQGERPGGGRFEVEDLLARVAGRIARAEDPALASQAPVLARALELTSAERRSDLPRGLVHGDLFRDNVLWSRPTGGPIAALLDFESASDGTFAYDLAVTILAWCFGDALDVSLMTKVIEGYESVRPLEPSERAGLHAEARMAALRFTVTRITDYAMRPSGAPGSRVMKDWRRFLARHDALVALGRIPFARRGGAS
jgi:homoserine kinase type II